MDDLEDRVRSLALPVVARHGAELVDLQVKRGRTQLVRVIAEQPGGIALDTCARISDELSRLLDADDPIPGRYTLEVTSPGLDRPLRTAEDFRKNLGRQVKVVLAQAQHEGVIEEVGEASVTVRLGQERGKPGRPRRDEGVIEISFADIAKATLVLPW